MKYFKSFSIVSLRYHILSKNHKMEWPVAYFYDVRFTKIIEPTLLDFIWSGFYLDEVLFCFIALLFHLVAMKEEKSNKCFNTIIILSITFGFCSKCKQVHNCDRCQLWYQFMFGLHYYSCNNIKHERPLAISNYLILKPPPHFTFYSDF